MLTTQQVLSFNKEKNGKWYVEYQKWEDERTKLFRQIYTWKDEDDKAHGYKEIQDMNDPKDDHTKHAEWAEFKTETHEALAMNESMTEVLEFLAKGKRQVKIETCGNGWVSNTYAHYHRESASVKDATYKLLYRDDLPKEVSLNWMARYILGDIFSEFIHARVAD